MIKSSTLLRSKSEAVGLGAEAVQVRVMLLEVFDVGVVVVVVVVVEEVVVIAPEGYRGQKHMIHQNF